MLVVSTILPTSGAPFGPVPDGNDEQPCPVSEATPDVYSPPVLAFLPTPPARNPARGARRPGPQPSGPPARGRGRQADGRLRHQAGRPHLHHRQHPRRPDAA